MKLVKILGKIALWIAIVVVVILLAMPLWFSPVVTQVANSVVPKLTGTAFTLKDISFNPYTGHFRLQDCHLANPEGYSAKEALAVELIDVNFAMLAFLRNRLHIETAEVKGTYVSYLGKDSVNNFDAIVAHVQKVLGIKEKDREEKEKEEKSEMKVIIERFAIEGTRVQIGFLPVAIPVPPFTITGIGVEEDGATFSETCEAFWKQVQKGMGSSTGAVGNVLGTAAGAIGKGTKGVAEGVTGGAKKLGEGAGKLLKNAGDLFK